MTKDEKEEEQSLAIKIEVTVSLFGIRNIFGDFRLAQRAVQLRRFSDKLAVQLHRTLLIAHVSAL